MFEKSCISCYFAKVFFFTEIAAVDVLKRIFKILKRLILSVLLLVYVLMALVNMGPVQSFLAARAADFFSKEWHTEVKIGALGVNIFHHVSIRDVLVRDLAGDTLIHAEHIYVSLGKIPSTKGIALSKVLLSKPVFRLVRNEEGMNLKFILDYFKSTKPKESKPETSPLEVRVARLTVENGSVAIVKQDTVPLPSFGVAPTYMEFTKLNLQLRGVAVLGDSVSFDMKQVSTEERSGFVLDNITGNVALSGKGIQVENLQVKTNKTNFHADILLKTSSWQSYADFMDSVHLSVCVHPETVIDLSDMAYWGHSLQGVSDTVLLSGKFEGTVADMQVDTLQLMLKDNTYLALSGHIKGLPEVKKTHVNIKIQDFTTSKDDLETIALPHTMSNFKLPESMQSVNFVSLQGEITGSMEDTKARLSVLSSVGEMELTAHLQSDAEFSKPEYEIALQTTEMDVGKWMKVEKMMPFNAQVAVKGKGFKFPDIVIDSFVVGIHNLNYKGNLYDRVNLYATMNHRVADARIAIEDENIDLNIAAVADFSGSVWAASVSGAINHAKFGELNLFPFPDSTAELSTRFSGHVSNFNSDELDAGFLLSNLQLQTSAHHYSLPSFSLSMESEQGSHHIESHSDLLDLSLQGQFHFQDIGTMVSSFMTDYLPPFAEVFNPKDSLMEFKTDKAVEKIKNSLPEDTHLQFSLLLNDMTMLQDLCLPFLSIAPKTVIEGKYTPMDSWKFNIGSAFVGIGESMKLTNVFLKTLRQNERYHFNLSVNTLAVSDSMEIKNLTSDIYTTPQGADLVVVFDDSLQQQSTNGRLHVQSSFSKRGIHLSLTESHISYAGLNWDVAEGNMIHYTKDSIGIKGLTFYNEMQDIALNGVVSKNKTDKLTLAFHEVDLSQFNPLLQSVGFQLAGRLNDHLEVMQVLDKPFFTSGLTVDSLSVNEILFDKAKIAVAGDRSFDVLSASIKLYRKGNKGMGTPLDITGVYYPKREENNLDFLVNLKTFDLRIISGLLSSFTSHLEGRISTENLTIKGSLKDPKIKGILLSERGKIKVNVLNTTYDFSGPIYIENNLLKLQNFTLKDDNASETNITGTIAHQEFKNIILDLHAKMNNFILLDTPPSRSSLYYGKVMSTATADLQGPLDNLKIRVEATTNQGTYLTVPVNSKISAMQNKFIIIGDSTTLNRIHVDTIVLPPAKTMGVDLSVKVNVTPQAKFFIPLDFNQIQGNVAVSGDGTVNIGMDSRGNLILLGTVVVAGGTLEMNMMDLVTKEFSLQSGGSITLAGSPVDVLVDITALHKTRTSLVNILGEEYNRNVEVQSVINFSGRLDAMTPSFDLRFPSVDDDTREKIFMEIDRNDEKEMIQQMASLLLLRQLYSNRGGYETNSLAGGLGANTMDMAFSQLSGLVSRLVPFMDNVDLNYNQGNNVNNDQIGVALSKSFGRFSISGGLDFAVGNNNAAANTSNSGDVQGNLDADYQLTPRLKLKAFNHSNANDFSKIHAPYTQGIGMIYTINFDNMRELFSFQFRNKNSSTPSLLPDTAQTGFLSTPISVSALQTRQRKINPR